MSDIAASEPSSSRAASRARHAELSQRGRDFLVYVSVNPKIGTIFIEQIVQIARDGAIVLVDEADGHAGVSSAPRASDSVDVVLDVLRRVVIDHQRHVGNVQSARGHVRRHQDLHAVELERAERVLAVGLGAVAVDGRGLEVLRGEIALQNVRLALRLHEDQDPSVSPVLQLVEEVGVLVGVLHVDHALLDVLRGAADAAHGEEDVVDEEVAREALDLVGERRGEHERLAVARHARLLHDVADLRLEAHVQHAVRLVQHEMAASKKRKPGKRDAFEAENAALDHVLDAAGRADEDVAAGAKRVQDFAHGRTAVDDGGGDAGAVAELLVRSKEGATRCDSW